MLSGGELLDGVIIRQQHELTELCYANLRVLKIAGVKQDKADKARHISNSGEGQPRLEEAVLGLSWESGRRGYSSN